MEKELKELKVSINELVQLANKTEWRSNEIDKAKKKLFLANAWLGKLFQEVVIPTSYKKTSETTETTEKNYVPKEINWGNNIKHLDQVNKLRKEIEKTVQKIIILNNNEDNKKNILVTREFNIARTNCYNYLCEAKFQLELELERVKD